jgi:hypothetical protein
LFFVGVGLLLTVLLWIGVTQVIIWSTGVLDLMHYGNPRTYQTDAVVGQGDNAGHPSHFVALNLRGQIVILDFRLAIPPGHASSPSPAFWVRMPRKWL